MRILRLGFPCHELCIVGLVEPGEGLGLVTGLPVLHGLELPLQVLKIDGDGTVQGPGSCRAAGCPHFLKVPLATHLVKATCS